MLTIEEYLRPEVIQKVRRLDLKARFIVEGFIAGLHRSPYHGFSVEFSEHRKYVPGDDVKTLDWNVLAKTGKLYVKKYRAETNLFAYLLVDVSKSMDFSSDPSGMSKLDYAICLAAALGFMMIGQQDSVGLVTFGERIQDFLRPRSTRAQLVNILGTLARTPPEGKTGLAGALVQVAELVTKRSLVLLLSDLLDDQAEVLRGMQRLRHGGHDLVVLQVLDDAEINFPFADPTVFADPESAAEVRADPEAIRANYLERFGTFTERYESECRKMGADFVQISTSMPFDKALSAFLVERKRRF